MGKSFEDKVDAYFVRGVKENASEINIMYVQAAKQKADLEKQAEQGPKITVEEIVLDPVENVIDGHVEPETKKKEEDFVL